MAPTPNKDFAEHFRLGTTVGRDSCLPLAAISSLSDSLSGVQDVRFEYHVEQAPELCSPQ